MADLTAKLIWYRLKEGWANMAESFDELICSFDTGESSMEVTTVLLVGWAIFCVLLVAVGRYVNQRFLRPQRAEEEEKTAGTPVTTDAATKATPTAASAAAPAAAKVSAAPASSAPRRKDTGARAAGPGPSLSPTSVSKPKDVFSAPTSEPKPKVPSGPVRRGGKAAAEETAPAEIECPVPIPFATGSERDAVNWVNNLLQWLYTDPNPIYELKNIWLDSLNEVAQKLAVENGVQVHFQEILEESTYPNMINVLADPGPEDRNLNILCDVEATVLKFVVQVTRQMGENFWSNEYFVNVDTLSGPLSVDCDVDELGGVIHFDCRPKIKLSLNPSPRSKLSNAVDEQALQVVVTEVISSSITHTSLDVNMAHYPECPRYVRSQVVIDPIIPVHYDSMITGVPTLVPPPQPKTSKQGKRLLVKIIKASNLGTAKAACATPFCIVELDEPSQKFTTELTEGSNPFWDEHFLFDLNNATGEILFEIYDKNAKDGQENFMGLAIISVDELLKNPSQRQIISLQSRPYEGDDVSGTLTVEFLFMEGADVPRPIKPPRPPPPALDKKVETNRTVTSDGTVVTTTRTTIRKTPLSTPVEESKSVEIECAPSPEPPPTPSPQPSPQPSPPPPQPTITTIDEEQTKDEIIVNGEDTVTSTALRELSRAKASPSSTDKSTLIIHSVQRVEKTKNGQWHEVKQPSDGSDYDAGSEPATFDSVTSLEEAELERSRPKERTSFMNTLRKRFSFRNKRSRSVDQQPSSRESSASRSASVDRARSLPGSREASSGGTNNLEVPGSRADNVSTRSSLSEMSGVSGSSAQTYIDEASMLVIETVENGITRHYLVPGSLASRSKWRKKGTKLHIYNDHTFIAKHLPGNINCEVCSKPFIRRIGKQGYECRDCQLKCHKPCHVRTDTHCSNSHVGTMELLRDLWVDIPNQSSARRSFSLKQRIRRLGQGLEPIPSSDALPTNNKEASEKKLNDKKKTEKPNHNSHTNHVH